MSTQDVQIGLGDAVWYHGFSEEPRPGIITGWGEKHGETVYDVTLTDGQDNASRWGYVDQFTRRS